MTSDELKTELKATGWNISSDSTNRQTGPGWYAWLPSSQRTTATLCACNKKPPSFVLAPSDFEMGQSRHTSVTFSLCGELPNSHWVELSVYSLPMKEAMGSIESSKQVLFAAWEAAANALRNKIQPEGGGE